MIAPGCIINASGQVLMTVGPDPNVHHFSCGNPFGITNRLILCSDVPVGNFPAMWGLRRTAKGAIFATATPQADDVFLAGLRISKLGQIVYTEVGVPVFNNGNPVVNGILRVTSV